jgi:hypothetical protein
MEHPMGWHECEYISREEAATLGLRHAEFAHSSGDFTLAFQSGRSWTMPDMAFLYLELGWVPPKDFMDDVMNSPLLTDRRQSTGTRIGYLNPTDNPLPKPFKINDALPTGFLEKLETHFLQAAVTGNRVQTRGASPGRAKLAPRTKSCGDSTHDL